MVRGLAVVMVLCFLGAAARMAVGAERINAQNHLWSSIRLARDSSADLLERDAQLVSANGMALPSSIRALSRSREYRVRHRTLQP